MALGGRLEDAPGLGQALAQAAAVGEVLFGALELLRRRRLSGGQLGERVDGDYHRSPLLRGVYGVDQVWQSPSAMSALRMLFTNVSTAVAPNAAPPMLWRLAGVTPKKPICAALPPPRMRRPSRAAVS